MSSVEYLLNVRKDRVADELVKEILDGWLKYVAGLEGLEKLRVQALDGVELNRELRKAYLAAEALKEGKGEKALPSWKLDKPSQSAEAEVRGARADKQQADDMVAFRAGLNNPLNLYLAPAAVGQAGVAYLYRNVGTPVDPVMVLGQGVYRGAVVMPAHTPVLTRIYQNDAASVIEGYVRSNEMFAGGQQIACMSMCTDPDSSLGRSPLWKFACPTPALQIVQPATIVAQLGVTALQAGSLQGGNWSLRTDTGAIAGANTVAFVCNGLVNERIFLTHLPLGPGFAFRKYQGTAYQCVWKNLDQHTIQGYTALAQQYHMDI